MHHQSWDVGSIQEVGLGSGQMARAGFTRGWGLGRHVLGANYFYYVRAPRGSYSEYSADIDFIPADCEWTAGDHADRKSTRLKSSHSCATRMPSFACKKKHSHYHTTT